MAFRTGAHHDRMAASSSRLARSSPSVVMPGIDPGIHLSSEESCRRGFAKWMDCRGKPGNYGGGRCPDIKPRKVLIMSASLQIGLVLFPRVTQLDFTGPLQVFSSVPGATVHLIWKRIEPVASDSVMMLPPTITFADCPQLDVICVPGGFGTDDMVNDEEMLDFLRQQAKGAKYITSVCTGSLVLGAAGLLRGYHTTACWTAMENLAPFCATPTRTRVCVDRNRVTGGGVTAGIDFALTLVSIMVDQQTAELIQLRLEYNPAPPFNAGSPATAPPELVAMFKEKIAPSRQRRSDAIGRAAARLEQRKISAA